MGKISGRISRRIIQLLCYGVIFIPRALGEIYPASPPAKLKIEISKYGLNRISNPPYKIMQLTGDDSKFRLKYDEDGANIYFMPLSKPGEHIEVSIRNNAGSVQDLDLIVANIEGRSIIIDGKREPSAVEREERASVSAMLRAMKNNAADKFYVQNTNQILGNIGQLTVRQGKIYKYKNLAGGVFKITNPTKKIIQPDYALFAGRFKGVQASYSFADLVKPRETVTMLIVQKLDEK